MHKIFTVMIVLALLFVGYLGTVKILQNRNMSNNTASVVSIDDSDVDAKVSDSGKCSAAKFKTEYALAGFQVFDNGNCDETPVWARTICKRAERIWESSVKAEETACKNTLK